MKIEFFIVITNLSYNNSRMTLTYDNKKQIATGLTAGLVAGMTVGRLLNRAAEKYPKFGKHYNKPIITTAINVGLISLILYNYTTVTWGKVHVNITCDKK